jgi:hypothetical protein
MATRSVGLAIGEIAESKDPDRDRGRRTMAKSLKDKVTEALIEAVGSDARIELEDVEHDRVGGIVLSGSFATQSPTQRQDHIWKSLDHHLDVSERARVVFIVTDTPEEYEALREAAG